MASSLTGSYEEKFVLENVGEVLRQAHEWDLQIEVFYTAFLYLKENPQSSIKEALEIGLSDWDI